LTVAATTLVLLPAAASADDLGPLVGPKQYFTGSVNGIASSGAAGSGAVIGVNCAGAAATGAPRAGQSVEVKLLVPPVAANVGYTGTAATSIEANLIWTNGEVVFVAPLANFKQYSVALPIPTDIKVPCSGTGEVSFDPQPSSSGAVSFIVPVTFESVGV
jgi:hypothetical protein